MKSISGFNYFDDEELERAFRIYQILKPVVLRFWRVGDRFFSMRGSNSVENEEGLEFSRFLKIYKETRGWQIREGWERLK